MISFVHNVAWSFEPPLSRASTAELRQFASVDYLPAPSNVVFSHTETLAIPSDTWASVSMRPDTGVELDMERLAERSREQRGK